MNNMDTNKEVTIYDIAEKLGLNPSTISRGLKGHFTVSKKTQNKINSTAEELGYRTNKFAVNLRMQKTRTIGIIVPRLNSFFMSEVIAGIESITNDAGYNILISQSSENGEKEASNARTMFNSRVDGLMVSLACSMKDIPSFDIFTKRNIPVLFFDRIPLAKNLPSVTIDNERAGYLATRHLLEKGAKRIIHVTGSQNVSVYKDRHVGYKNALELAGIPYNEEFVISNDLSERSGMACANFVLDNDADGVFVDNDTCAASCMNELKRQGIDIPKQIAFVGFNNDMISRNVDPPLTTINYSGYEMGKISAKSILKLLNGIEASTDNVPIILDSFLVERESSNRKPL